MCCFNLNLWGLKRKILLRNIVYRINKWFLLQGLLQIFPYYDVDLTGGLTAAALTLVIGDVFPISSRIQFRL